MGDRSYTDVRDAFYEPGGISHGPETMTETHQDDIEAALKHEETIEEVVESLDGFAFGEGPFHPNYRKRLRALLTDWRRRGEIEDCLHKEIIALRNDLEAEAAALSETRAVLEVLAGAVRSFFANPMTMPPEKRVQFERLKDALTRAAELEKRNG